MLGEWFDNVKAALPRPRYILPEPFGHIDIRPGRMTLLDGAPGAGKTALLMQISTELFRMNTSARLLIGNAEMAPGDLLERVISRLSGVALRRIIDRKLDPVALANIEFAVETLGPLVSRMAFVGSPFSLEHVYACSKVQSANVIVLDYLQRISSQSESSDRREQLDDAVSSLRRCCELGAAVFAASAVSRQKGPVGPHTRASAWPVLEVQVNWNSARILPICLRTNREKKMEQ